MRKARLIALGLATVGALVSAQRASATKKTICRDHYAFIGPTYKLSSACNTDAAYAKNNCRVTERAGGLNLKECFDVKVVTPTGPWKGTTGLTKTFSPSTNLKSK
jgi:hypothetical protein